MSHYLVGLTTALRNSAIAMTVIDAYDYTPPEGSDDEETTTVTAIYFANGVLQTVQLDSEQFIGFGDFLIYEDGQFTEAGSHDDETGDDDDDDSEGPDSDEPEA
jgi:hypothetical protein